MDTVEERKNKFLVWSNDNLGEGTDILYAPYLERLGVLLREFNMNNGKEYFDNFFYYRSYEEFKDVYTEIIEQTDDEISKILRGELVRYSDYYSKQKLEWKQKYAQMVYDHEEGDKTNNFEGIVAFGVLLRAYLKYLYYAEDSSLTYPERSKKVLLTGSEFDDSLNYWLYAPGDNARLWDEFYQSNVMGIGWDYLGDLKEYNSRIEIENKIAEHRNDGKKPRNDSKAVWNFLREIKTGDVVYAKAGMKRIVGRGVVTGEYYYDNDASEYKHRHKINWTNEGSWYLKGQVAMKTLTNFNEYPDVLVYIDSLINGEAVEENSLLVNEFKTWLSQQVQPNGEFLNDKTIAQKVSSLRDIEKYFTTIVFGETNTEELKKIREIVLENKNYDRYKGVSGSSLDYYIRYVESRPTIGENEPYLISDFLVDVFTDKKQIIRLQSVLQNKKNLILKGAPGVGKTFVANRLAYLMMKEKDDSRIQMIQFHQSYSYEDFIEGYRPKSDGEGFELKEGPFVKFARKAMRDSERDYFFIIDEINRGNMSKIFGELMVLIETDKRGKSINLLYSNEKFWVPENLYIIGMMNTADRSLALLDYALRRRFAFYEIEPAFENNTFKDSLAKMENANKVSKVIGEIIKLNKLISEELGRGFQIGHSYFTGKAFVENADKRIGEVIEYEIIPQLYEYWFDDEDKATEWAIRLRGACDGD